MPTMCALMVSDRGVWTTGVTASQRIHDMDATFVHANNHYAVKSSPFLAGVTDAQGQQRRYRVSAKAVQKSTKSLDRKALWCGPM
jgi:hypothetical protein